MDQASMNGTMNRMGSSPNVSRMSDGNFIAWGAGSQPQANQMINQHRMNLLSQNPLMQAIAPQSPQQPIQAPQAPTGLMGYQRPAEQTFTPPVVQQPAPQAQADTAKKIDFTPLQIGGRGLTPEQEKIVQSYRPDLLDGAAYQQKYGRYGAGYELKRLNDINSFFKTYNGG